MKKSFVQEILPMLYFSTLKPIDSASQGNCRRVAGFIIRQCHTLVRLILNQTEGVESQPGSPGKWFFSKAC